MARATKDTLTELVALQRSFELWDKMASTGAMCKSKIVKRQLSPGEAQPFHNCWACEYERRRRRIEGGKIDQCDGTCIMKQCWLGTRTGWDSPMGGKKGYHCENKASPYNRWRMHAYPWSTTAEDSKIRREAARQIADWCAERLRSFGVDAKTLLKPARKKRVVPPQKSNTLELQTQLDELNNR